MSRWKPILIFTLLALPVLAFVTVGAWMLWTNGWLFWLWWLYPACWGGAYLLIRWWNPRRDASTVPGPIIPNYWTDRDRQAMELVEAEQRRVKQIPHEKLGELRFYWEAANELSLKIARHYHPTARDPVSSLTVPEVLAAAHLAMEELERWVERYVPGSHVLTIRQWQALSNAPRWIQIAGDVSWLASMLWSPLNAGRYVLSRMTMSSASRQMQANLLAWFYAMYVRHIGFYLIEMNSGRLRGGADRYRQATGGQHPIDDPTASDTELSSREVKIAVVGQVKAGKSSLINSLLGERKAAVDVVPLTKTISQYRLTLPDRGDQLTFLDTAGYADDGATREQREQAILAFEQADLVLLVLRATSPARAADVEFLTAMRESFDDHPEMKPPPVVGVLTHVDGLRPVMEWSPPYDWQHPSSAKETAIRDAVQFNVGQFESLLAAVVPICSDVVHARIYGVQEWLMPAITTLLGEARGCAMLRTLHNDLESGQVRKTFQQLRASGWQVLQACLWGPAAGM